MRNSAKRRLTEQTVERIVAPAQGRRLEIGDELCPGLVLRVSEHGARSFSVIYRVPGEGGATPTGRALAGKQHRVTLGRWPAINLIEARDRARTILQQAGAGTDARVVKAAAIRERQENSFSAVFQRHIEQDAARTISSWRNVDRVVRLHVVPSIGDMPLADVRRSEVHRILDELVAKDRVGTAREVRKHLSRFFNWAVDRELIQTNPIYGLRRNDLLPDGEAGRALADHELIAIWQAADELRYPFGWLFQMLILTGQRRAEWAEAKRSELDAGFGSLELSRERFKGRRSHIVPLAAQASTLMQRLPVWASADYYLFSSQAGRVPVSGFSQAKKRLDELAETKLRELVGDPSTLLAPYRVHDFRVTCETRLAQLGFGRDVRDAVLGHAKPGLQKTYNKYDYLDEKRAALAAYAAHVMEIVDRHR